MFSSDNSFIEKRSNCSFFLNPRMYAEAKNALRPVSVNRSKFHYVAYNCSIRSFAFSLLCKITRYVLLMAVAFPQEMLIYYFQIENRLNENILQNIL